MNPAAPHSVESERGVLGSILQSPSEAIPKCIGKIEPRHFFIPAHRTIFDILVDLWNAEKPIDLITFTQVLRDRNLLDSVGGPAFITELSTFVPTAANVDYYIETVREKYESRRMNELAKEIQRRGREGQAPSEILAFIEGELGTMRSSREKRIQFFAPSELRDFHPNHELVLSEAAARASHVEPEFVDCKGLEAGWGMKRSLAYALLADGKIRGVSLRRRNQVRGKRLFVVDSVREFLRKQMETGQ
jgi:DnaB-like helicase N terminal domain